jgi:carbonic anhydrase/acetyltransferase-like protein (isoleucine patch superfamily)
MSSVVMDNCVIESNSIVAAGSVVTQGTHIRAGELWGGVPAKKIKDVSQELISGEIDRIANNYVKYSSWYKEEK